ncbi:ShlB/FhaC/HecB family hemolysin secretion/activation protein [Thalassospira sp.]|uniref:ShlB/FhaC/HecB family hemolysin secretion/activation protein n=1 Tax=Thalassospira sp. TaxID=1912094 RepID=UPI003AA93145
MAISSRTIPGVSGLTGKGSLRPMVHAMKAVLRAGGMSGICVLAPLAAHAQQAPNSVQSDQQSNPLENVIRQEQRQKQINEFNGFELPEIVDGSPDFTPPKAGAGAKFTVQRFDINRSEILDDQTIRDVLEKYVGRSLYLADLYDMLAEFNELYHEKGFVTARAYIPPQKIAGGEVRVILVEGRVGRLRVEQNDYMLEDYITSSLHIQEGDLVSLDVLEKALSRFNRLHQTKLTARLEPGENFGQTDIVVTAKEPDRMAYSLFIDNYGALSTGHRRSGGYARANSLFGIDDPLTVGVTESRGSRSVFTSYELPVNSYDTRLSVGYTQTRIHIIDGPFADDPADPDVYGQTQLITASLKQPFILSPHWLMNVDYSYNGNISYTTFGAALTETWINRHSIGVDFNYLGDTGFYSFGLRGHRMFSHIRQAATEYRVTSKYTANAFAYQQLGGPFTAQVTAGGQMTKDRVLPPAEQFSVGGVGTMRGYEPGAFSGDDGYFIDTELHYNFNFPTAFWKGQPENTQASVYVFFDHAGAFRYRDGSQNDRYRREDFTSAAGIGVRVNNFVGIGSLDAAFFQDLDYNTNNEEARKPSFLISLRMNF